MKKKELDDHADESAYLIMEKTNEMVLTVMHHASVGAAINLDEDGKMSTFNIYQAFQGTYVEMMMDLTMKIADAMMFLREEFTQRDDENMIIDFDNITMDEFLKAQDRLKDRLENKDYDNEI